MNINVEIWKIIDGKIVELKDDNNVFVLKEQKTGTIFSSSIGETIIPSMSKKLPTKPIRHNVKKPYLEKWITNGSFEVFTLEMFFKAYPRQKENNRLDSIINRLIADKKIAQLTKGKYMVNRGK